MNKIEYKRILIVEDSNKLRNALTDYFSVMNKVTACPDLRSAIAAANERAYDIVLLDLILPDGNGLSLFDYLGKTPVVILSDLGADANILEGLSSGAADYIVKPCSLQVVEARMYLRLLPASKAKLSLHGFTLNVADRTAVFENSLINLTSNEFNILLFLMQNAGVFFTANEIYENVWKMPPLNTETVKKHMSNLRKKLFCVSDNCAALLLSKFGKGYAFKGEEDA